MELEQKQEQEQERELELERERDRTLELEQKRSSGRQEQELEREQELGLELTANHYDRRTEMTSDTPRTDAHYGRLPNNRQTRGSVRDYEHAAKLERELAAKEVELLESRATVARLREALLPFSHADLREIHSNNVEGISSPVFGRNNAKLLIGDFCRAADALASLPDQSKRDAAVLRAAEELCNATE